MKSSPLKVSFFLTEVCEHFDETHCHQVLISSVFIRNLTPRSSNLELQWLSSSISSLNFRFTSSSRSSYCFWFRLIREKLSTITLSIVSSVRNRPWQHIKQRQPVKHRITKRNRCKLCVRHCNRQWSTEVDSMHISTRLHFAFTTMIRERTKTRNISKVCYVYLTYLQQRRWSCQVKWWHGTFVRWSIGWPRSSMWKRIESLSYFIMRDTQNSTIQAISA